MLDFECVWHWELLGLAKDTFEGGENGGGRGVGDKSNTIYTPRCDRPEAGDKG